jgi:hypothetical protein
VLQIILATAESMHLQFSVTNICRQNLIVEHHELLDLGIDEVVGVCTVYYDYACN